MKWLGRILLAVVLVLVLAGAWLGASLVRTFQNFPAEGVFVEVPRGARARQIATLLESKGVVRNRWAFEALCRWRSHRPLQTGEYKFDRPQTAFEVFETLALGRVYQQALLVPEGKTMFEIAALVEQGGFASRDDFLAAARDVSLVRDLAPRARNLEGFLFPATYQFPRRTGAREIVAAMVRRFRNVWEKLPQPPSAPRRLTAGELVTLASLVERETGVAEERTVVAGVFYNSLQRGMPLECDPTVIYALELQGKYRGMLYRRDLRFASPYNTYRNRGLPPGPIANPGEAALRATLHPAKTNYLFFVADAQGGHLFSRTLREHNANVARYRRLLSGNGAARSRPGSSASRGLERSGDR